MALHRRSLFGVVLAGLGGTLAASLAGPAEAQPLHRYPPVPPPRLERPPGRPPGRRLAWQPGHWQWTGRGYAWVPGQWVRARRGRWADGHWAERRGGQVWVPGGWR